jgi:Na+-translocating ferredoxin:NAD+ oxidoreductase RnfD subunit
MGVGVRLRLAVLVGLVVAAISGLAWRTYTVSSGSLVPRPPWPALVLLLVMASFVVAMAWPVRRYLRGRATRTLDPLRAARVVVLAQAAVLTGAAAAGWYAGQLAVVLGGLGLLANRDRLLPLGLAVLASVVLAGAGLLGQRWCRVEPPRDDEDDRAGE